MKDKSEGSLGWTAPIFAPNVSGTIQQFPLTVRVRTIPNNMTKREVHFKLDGYHWYEHDPGSDWSVQWYDVIIPEIKHSERLEIHTRYWAGGVGSEWAFSGQFRLIKPLGIISPPQNSIVFSSIVITGTGAWNNPVIEVTTGDMSFKGTANLDGTWSAVVENLPIGRHSFQATQSFDGVTSKPSPEWYLKVIESPRIISPVNNAVIAEAKPIVSGAGEVNTWIRLYRQGNLLDSYGSGVVKNDRRWEIKLTKELPWGGFILVAEQSLENIKSLSNAVALTVNQAPIISDPASGSLQPQSFCLSGTSAIQDATLTVYKDLETEKVGEAVVSAGNWNVRVNVQPGPASLVVMQTVNNVPSLRGAPRDFKIRPPVLEEPEVTYSDTTLKFSGTGYFDPNLKSEIQFTVDGGPVPVPVPPNAPVNPDGTWETAATDWPLDRYEVTVIQRIEDRAGGWIDSHPCEFSVYNWLPQVTDITHTKVYRPVFSGKGYTTAIVRFRHSDGHEIAPDTKVVNGEWSSQALENLGPTKEQKVFIGQSLPDHSPEPCEYFFSIPPEAPGLNNPEENGNSPKFSGTCWPGAEVVLAFNGEGAYRAETNGASWTYQKPGGFLPGDYTITATQTAAEQVSEPVSKGFKVYPSMLQPQITEPQENEKVGSDMIVTGTNGMAGASMQLRDVYTGWNLGPARVLSVDGRWSIKLRNLPLRQYIIDAQQTLEGTVSERSLQRQFEVVLLAPVITRPAQNGTLPRTGKIEGTGWRGARVEIWDVDADELLLKDIEVNPHNSWSAEVKQAAGGHQIRARQTYNDAVSQESPVRDYSVVPDAPSIETPTDDDHIGRRLNVSGFGVAGDRVMATLGTAQAETTVEADRTWSLVLNLGDAAGDHELHVVATCGEFISAPTTRSVVVANYLPCIDAPQPGRRVHNPVDFKGHGRPGVGQLVSWFNPDLPWLASVSVEHEQWQGQSEQLLPEGGNWCWFQQTLTEGKGETVSDRALSSRFDVELQPASGVVGRKPTSG